MTRTEYKQMWDRWQRRIEAKYTAKIRKVLRLQVDTYQAAGYVPSEPMREVLQELYREAGVQWAAKTGIHRKNPVSIKARMPMGFSERIVELMRMYYGDEYFFNWAEEITDTTRKDIENIFAQAAITGASIDEITQQLADSSKFGLKRARMIARTETVTAANQAAILNAQDTGIPMQKVWLSVRDKRTRRTHIIADNQTVALEDPFKVGTTEMMQPGVRKTPEGLEVPAREVIRCRCVVAFRVIK